MVHVEGLNAKWSYWLLYSIAIKTISHSALVIVCDMVLKRSFRFFKCIKVYNVFVIWLVTY